MQENVELRQAFFEDLGQVEDDLAVSAREILEEPDVPDWVLDHDAATRLRRALTSPDDVGAFSGFVASMVRTAVHSVLVAIDGGAASAEIGRVFLVDGDGRSLGDGLHELYFDHLGETGRLS